MARRITPEITMPEHANRALPETANGSRPQVRYEVPAPKVARIILDRPEKRNAQGTVMTYELDAAMQRACFDDDISVIILAADGEHFNAGHDLSGSEGGTPERDKRTTLWGEYGGAGWEG